MLPNGFDHKRIQPRTVSAMTRVFRPSMAAHLRYRQFRGPISIQNRPPPAPPAPEAETAPSHDDVHLSTPPSPQSTDVASSMDMSAQDYSQNGAIDQLPGHRNYARNSNGQYINNRAAAPVLGMWDHSPRPHFGLAPQPYIYSPGFQPTGGMYVPSGNGQLPVPVMQPIPLVYPRVDGLSEQQYYNWSPQLNRFQMGTPGFAGPRTTGPIFAAPTNVAPYFAVQPNAGPYFAVPSNAVPYAVPPNAAPYAVPPNAAPFFAASPNGAVVFAPPKYAGPMYTPSLHGAPVFPAPSTLAEPLLCTVARNRAHPQIADFGCFKLYSAKRKDGYHYVPAKWVQCALRELIKTDPETGRNTLYTVTGCMLLESVKAKDHDVTVFNHLASLGSSTVYKRSFKYDRLVKCPDVAIYVRFVIHAINVVWGASAFKAPFVPPPRERNEFGFCKFANGKIAPYVIMFGASKYVPVVFFPPTGGVPELVKHRVEGLPLAYLKYSSLCLGFAEAVDIWQNDVVDAYKLDTVSQYLHVAEENYNPSQEQYSPDFIRKSTLHDGFPAWLTDHANYN